MQTDEVLLNLLTRLCSDDNSVREIGADEVTDIAQNLPKGMVRILETVLLGRALMEENDGARESQLNALSDIKEWHGLDRLSTPVLRMLDRNRLKGSQVEHLEYLLEE